MGYFLKVHKPIGIEVISPVIFDERGPFYNEKGKRRINLPVGIYSINGEYKIIPFIQFRLPKLPAREKPYRVPDIDQIDIRYVPGIKHKAQIKVGENKIELNENLRHCTSAEFYAVFCHELGHYRYYTEWKCDIYSIRTMLQLGFNPSQIRVYLKLLKDGYRKELAIVTAKSADYELHENTNVPSNWLRNLSRFFGLSK